VSDDICYSTIGYDGKNIYSYSHNINTEIGTEMGTEINTNTYNDKLTRLSVTIYDNSLTIFDFRAGTTIHEQDLKNKYYEIIKQKDTPEIIMVNNSDSMQQYLYCFYDFRTNKIRYDSLVKYYYGDQYFVYSDDFFYNNVCCNDNYIEDLICDQTYGFQDYTIGKTKNNNIIAQNIKTGKRKKIFGTNKKYKDSYMLHYSDHELNILYYDDNIGG
jgi:hypothetical protein